VSAVEILTEEAMEDNLKRNGGKIRDIKGERFRRSTSGISVFVTSLPVA
jgi:hypothetical protein